MIRCSKIKLNGFIVSLLILMGGGGNKVISVDMVLICVAFLFFLNYRVKPCFGIGLFFAFVFFFLYILTPLYQEPLGFYSPIYSMSPNYNFEPLPIMFRLAGYFFLLYLLTLIELSNKTMDRILGSFIAIAVFNAFFCILEFYYGLKVFNSESADIVMQNTYRVRGPFGDPNATAGMLVPGIIVAFDRFIKAGRKSEKIVCILLLLFILIGMATTSSRTAVLALLISLAVLIVGTNVSRNSKILIALVSVLLILAFLPFYLNERELSLSSDSSASVRLDLIKGGIDAIGYHPIFGRGYQSGYHNIFIDLLVSGGVLLLSTFSLLIALAILNVIKLSKFESERFILIPIITGFIVTGFGISILNNVLFWTVIGLCLNSKLFTKN